MNTLPFDQKFGIAGADGNISQMSIKMSSYLKEKSNSLKTYIGEINLKKK